MKTLYNMNYNYILNNVLITDNKADLKGGKSDTYFYWPMWVIEGPLKCYVAMYVKGISVPFQQSKDTKRILKEFYLKSRKELSDMLKNGTIDMSKDYDTKNSSHISFKSLAPVTVIPEQYKNALHWYKP